MLDNDEELRTALRCIANQHCEKVHVLCTIENMFPTNNHACTCSACVRYRFSMEVVQYKVDMM